MPELETEDIKEILPHRYPFLLVDRVLELDKKHIISYKNVTANEEFFNGHFPGKPLMPAVLQVEAMAQSGAIMLMKMHVEKPENNLVVFTNINQAKFRKSVTPGDQFHMDIRLTNRRRNFITMEGAGTVDGKIACELEATAAIVPRKK
ncbi:MAG TPA: 3-hydroxyacyl-ACP dehydratase FabZ [Balneolaceae bacterium]|nr:3-hydroxyacyl-ACP dehydratase FabZ [Balneolaceae bacterium]